jgi:hypothetical protein
MRAVPLLGGLGRWRPHHRLRLCVPQDRGAAGDVLEMGSKPFGAAPELVVKTKPPEKDLDFTDSLHEANSTNREQLGKPLFWDGTLKIIA